MIDAALIQNALRAAIIEIQSSNCNHNLLLMLARALDEAQSIDCIVQENRGFRFRYNSKHRRP
jgi:hypothetical protein